MAKMMFEAFLEKIRGKFKKRGSDEFWKEVYDKLPDKSSDGVEREIGFHAVRFFNPNASKNNEDN